MKTLLKYVGLIFSAITIIILIVLFTGDDDKNVSAEVKNSGKAKQEFSSEQYKMYFSFVGDKTQIIDLIKGKASFNLAYSGSSRFTAKLLNLDGTLLTALADQNGPYNQKQIVDVPETSSYLLDVSTSGEWSLSRN